MFVVMADSASEAEIIGVKSQILAEGLTPFEHVGAERIVIAVVGEIGARQPRRCIERLGALPGVETVTPISRPFKLTSREFHPEDTVIRVLDAVDRRRLADGDGRPVLRREPRAAVRDRRRRQGRRRHDPARRRLQAAHQPVRLPGPGRRGPPLLAEARERTGLPIITEVMEPTQVDIVAEYADILQIGTRNMQNFSLLRDVGRVARPVMLKRGYGATIEEWLMAAEYIVSSGNPNVILCERGIRTFETYTRNTLDLAAVPLAPPPDPPAGHRRPVATPPGKRWLVKPLAIGGVAVGADGVMVEVHPTPDEALSDAEQQLTLEQFRDLMAAIVAGPRARPRRSTATRSRPAPPRPSVAARRSPKHSRSTPEDVVTSSSRPPACAASCGCPATSRSATGRCCSRRSPPARAGSRAPATAPTCAPRAGDRAGASAATVERVAADGRPRRRLPGRIARRRRAAGAGRRSSTAATPARACGSSRAARRAARDLHPRRRRVVAPPSGGSYHRTAAPRWARCSTVATTTPFLP